MMRSRGLMMLAGAIVALTVSAADTQAAKGVKKTAEHKYHGTVIAVHKHAHHHTLTIRLHHHKSKKKGQTAAKTAAAKAVTPANPTTPVRKHHRHTFTVNHKTHFEVMSKGSHHTASLRAVHLGEHVVVFAHHHHADKVVIHSPSQQQPQQPPTKKKAKSRKT